MNEKLLNHENIINKIENKLFEKFNNIKNDLICLVKINFYILLLFYFKIFNILMNEINKQNEMIEKISNNKEDNKVKILLDKNNELINNIDLTSKLEKKIDEINEGNKIKNEEYNNKFLNQNNEMNDSKKNIEFINSLLYIIYIK